MLELLLITLLQTQQPCSINSDNTCITIDMHIDGTARAFTAQDLGKDPKTISENAYCQAHLSKGSLRYFTNSTAPSAMIGILAPALNSNEASKYDTSGTLENGDTIILYNKELILGFKATQSNWGGAELTWECKL